MNKYKIIISNNFTVTFYFIEVSNTVKKKAYEIYILQKH
jgi:hypothetical protein